jgi:glycosyltransferase involved in cell wall biosynthesis
VRLDVIVPTYNRQDLLAVALSSLFAAEIPAGLEVGVTVVDNNSRDRTRDVVAAWRDKVGERLSYRIEARQGRSHALNAGITGASGDLIGIIDDDEEIDRDWYNVAGTAFNTRDVDFIGGPYLPQWSAPPPQWLPASYGSVVGWVNGGDREVPFDDEYPGILMGGNAVIRRQLLLDVGLYATWLGRTDKGLLSGEDEELYGRLLASGAKGLYLPTLKIYHHVPPERLTKRYFRSWCFWRGVSLGLLERTQRQTLPYLFGVPRWHYRSAARGLASAATALFMKPKDASRAFASELGLWDFLGLFYGRHFRRPHRTGSQSL